jgi:hypothetical protein
MDVDVRRAIREIERHGQTVSTIAQLVENLPKEQLLEIRKNIDDKILKKMDWLDDLEGCYFSENYQKQCDCVVSWNKDGPSDSQGYPISNSCPTCHGLGTIFELGNFEKFIEKADGLVIDISSEHLRDSRDWDMRTLTEAIDSKPMFIRHLSIDGGQFIRYVIIYPAPKKKEQADE